PFCSSAALTVTASDAAGPSAPSLSVAHARTVTEPVAANACATETPPAGPVAVAVVPSPQSIRYEKGLAASAEDGSLAAKVQVRVWPATAVAGPLAAAVGATLRTVTVMVSVDVACPSLTVSVTV